MRYLLSLLLLVITFAPTQALAQADGFTSIPETGTRERIEAPPAKPMFMYRDGERVALTQDFGFVAFRFREGHPSKEERHVLYAKVRLVISEIRETALLSEGYYALRLVPGATETQWNIFADQLRQSPELTYVGRVFSQRREDGLMDLLVSTPAITVRWKGPVAAEAMRRIESQYPLVLDRVEEGAMGAVFTLRDLRLDSVELANTLFHTGQFASVEPVFITVAGQPVTPEVSRRVMDGAMRAMPEEMRRQLEQKAEGMMPSMPTVPPEASEP